MASLTQISGSTTRRRSCRRGTIAIVALLVLSVMGALIAEHARRVLMERRQLKQSVVERQADALAEAALLIAASALKADPAWTGLEWKLPVGAIHQTNSAEVLIQAQDGDCTVVVRYPVNSRQPVRVTRSRKVNP